MNKSAWAILIGFFVLVFGLPIMAMLNTAQLVTGVSNTGEIIADMEKKKAKLKEEHAIQYEKNMKAIHDGTYKTKSWDERPQGTE